MYTLRTEVDWWLDIGWTLLRHQVFSYPGDSEIPGVNYYLLHSQISFQNLSIGFLIINLILISVLIHWDVYKFLHSSIHVVIHFANIYCLLGILSSVL